MAAVSGVQRYYYTCHFLSSFRTGRRTVSAAGRPFLLSFRTGPGRPLLLPLVGRRPASGGRCTLWSAVTFLSSFRTGRRTLFAAGRPFLLSFRTGSLLLCCWVGRPADVYFGRLAFRPAFSYGCRPNFLRSASKAPFFKPPKFSRSASQAPFFKPHATCHMACWTKIRPASGGGRCTLWSAGLRPGLQLLV